MGIGAQIKIYSCLYHISKIAAITWGKIQIGTPAEGSQEILAQCCFYCYLIKDDTPCINNGLVD